MNFKKGIIFSLGTIFFIGGIIVNTISSQSLFNLNLNVVPLLQNEASESFIWFMNLISNIFNPIVCAGYIVVFFLFSHRKLEIMVFLIWFSFLTLILSLLKQAYAQARPYWIQNSGIRMLEWTCYTEYGCPSGHSMMGLILMEFIIRFFSRVNQTVQKYIYLFYVLLVIFQLLVMFSRVILGMHSFNQVIFGTIIGLYSFLIYYLYMESFIIIMICKLRTKSSIYFANSLIICSIIVFILEICFTFLPFYQNEQFETVIIKTEGCNKYKEVISFQYKCFEDSAIIVVAAAVVLGFYLIENPMNLMKKNEYPKFSKIFASKIFFSIILSLIPVAIFLNPFWQDIQTNINWEATILWLCNIFAFILAVPILIVFVPFVTKRFNTEMYINFINFDDFIEVETFSKEEGCLEKRRITELSSLPK